MFLQKLRSIPPYTEGIFDSVMSNITANNYEGDQSLLVTLRALLFNRLEAGQNFKGNVCYDRHNMLTDSMFVGENCIAIYNVTNEETLKSVDDFVDKHSEFESIKTLADGLMAKAEIVARFVYNKEKNCGIIFVQELTMRKYHTVQGFIHKLLPAIFEQKPVTDEERAILVSLTKNRSEAYLEALKAVEKNFDIKGMILETSIKGFEQKQSQKIIRQLEREIETIVDNIKTYSDHITEALKRKNDLNIRMRGLRYSETDNTLYEYLKANKNIDITDIKPENGYMQINVHTYLQHFDTEMWMQYREREGGVLDYYTGSNTEYTREDRKLLLDAIFNEFPVLKVKMVACYDLIIGTSVSARQLNDWDKNECPNPHIQMHTCLGGYRNKITDALVQGDMSLAIEQCVASAGSVNLGEDGPTFGPMLNEWFSSSNDGKFIVNENGDEMTVREAIAWLKETGYKGITVNKIDFNEEDE